MVKTPHLLAAVDLGSNSFRLIVGRVEETPSGSPIYQVDALREPVRLAAGLSSDKMLDRASQLRGWDALKRFGERLRDFHPDRVRAVATNTLRVAKNADEFASSHSITSSAAASNVVGISTPSALAVFRLTTVVNFIGCSIGMSPAFAPLRILSTNTAAWRDIAAESTPVANR